MNSAIEYGVIHLVRSQNFLKNYISHPLVRKPACAYQGVRKVSFSENLGMH